MTPIGLLPLFRIKFVVDTPAHAVGALPHGYARRVACVNGGDFQGERLSGRVLPGGADILLERPDGALHLDVRVVLKTNEGELIYMTYNGRRNGADYFRILVQFETASKELSWLNDKVAVGTGTREPGGPVYDIWEIG